MRKRRVSKTNKCDKSSLSEDKNNNSPKQEEHSDSNSDIWKKGEMKKEIIFVIIVVLFGIVSLLFIEHADEKTFKAIMNFMDLFIY